MRKKLLALVLLVGVVLLALGGCDLLGGVFGASVEDYFPLAEGAEWDYVATIEFYDDPGNPDFVATLDYEITLYVAGTTTIGEVETYELKIKDFYTDDPNITVADVEADIAGVSIYVAATDDGIEVFGIEVSQSDSVPPGESGEATSFDLSGTFTQGFPILPAFIFAGATAEFDVTQEEIETDYILGVVDSIKVDSLAIDSEVAVVTDGNKREILGKDYRGALMTVNVQVDVVDTLTYPDNPSLNEDHSGSMTSTGAVFFAKKLGIASLNLNWDWGDATDNEGKLETMSLELVGATMAD